MNLTPERFALKPLKPEEELERDLLEYQQTKLRLEMDSPTPNTTSQLGRTVLNFSPIGESTKIGSNVTKTPVQSSVTPLLRRLMIRNAEEDRRERDNFLIGRSASKLAPVLETTQYDRLSMDLASLWGPDDSRQGTNHDTESMVEETVDLTATSPLNPSVQGTKPVESKTSSIMRALRRQTMHFTQNATLDISPQAVKENVATFINKSLTVDPEVTLQNDSVEIVESDSFSKVPKICAAQRKSLEEDSLRDDIVRAKEELLSKAVIINKSDKRRSLMPAPVNTSSSVGQSETQTTLANTNINKVNRRRTLFNVNAITEGGLSNDSVQGGVKAAAKRKTLLPSSSQSINAGTKSPSPVEKKKVKKSLNPSIATNGGSVKSRKSLLPTNSSQTMRTGSNMGPPAVIPPPPANQTKVSVTKPVGPLKRTGPNEGSMKRKLFNSVADLSPVSSPVQSPAKSKIKLMPKPRQLTEISVKEPPSSQPKKTFNLPSKKNRRSTLDFQEPLSSNSSVSSSSISRELSSSRGTMGYGGGAVRGQRNVIVLTNGKDQHLDYIKEVNIGGVV